MPGDPRLLPSYYRPYQPIPPEQREKIIRLTMDSKLTVPEIAAKVGVTPYQVQRTKKEPKNRTRLKMHRQRMGYKQAVVEGLGTKVAEKALRRLDAAMEDRKKPDGTVLPARDLEPKEIRDIGWLTLAMGKASRENLGEEAKDAALDADLELADMAKKVFQRKVALHGSTDVPENDRPVSRGDLSRPEIVSAGGDADATAESDPAAGTAYLGEPE